jgi:hypothetical protein
MLKICFSEEKDANFIKWISNLLHKFIVNGSLKLVGQEDNPDLMFASIWRRHPFIKNLPAVLVSNENWRLFPAHYPLDRYQAIIGITPPPITPTLYVRVVQPPFLAYPYEIVHFGYSLDGLMKKRDELLKRRKSKFCCFVVSNSSYGDLSKRRFEIFSEINAYKTVDSAGTAFNNVGYLAPKNEEFFEWISDYKFMICLENSDSPGYITEKALQAYISGTIPIYCGGKKQALNSDSYIDASEREYLTKLISLDMDDEKYTRMRLQSLYKISPSLKEFEEKFEKLFILNSSPY